MTGILSTAPMTVYADTSETNPDQENKQKNVGSGNAEQNNCAQNLINAGADDNCRNINGGDGGMNGGGGNGPPDGELVTICHVSASGVERTMDLPASAAASHLEQHDGPPGAGLDYEGECDGRSLT